jgi:hypothetical protein
MTDTRLSLPSSLILAALCVSLAPVVHAEDDSSDAPVVQTKNGPVRGTAAGRRRATLLSLARTARSRTPPLSRTRARIAFS